ncbi:MAG: glycosyltransferase family 2 protein [Leptolyngbyaceae cyanobacterium SL_7_1]|nr:glycosyltransferase family 2 protein [Leptolyngbyaceae cyanobacterium SL_7_1]
MIETVSNPLTSVELSDRPLVSVVMPCLNEEEALSSCIEKIQSTFAAAHINGEIVVCDNGSTDNSVAIAESMGVRVVHQPLRGYGNAYSKGFANAHGTFLIMGDADDTYDFRMIPQFLDYLCNKNYEFVTGSRYLHGGQTAIPFLHRLFGNPALTALLNFLFGTRYTDVYCGFRGFSRAAYEAICPVSPGMEFNLELAINAGLANLRIAEIPIQLHPRKGESKLRTMRDGWRSLRMMLLYCPNKIFLYPGLAILLLGVCTHITVLLNLVHYQGRSLGAVTGIFATIFSVVGFEILNLGLHAKTYSWSRRFDRNNLFLRQFYKRFNLESGLLLGLSMMLGGSLILVNLVVSWIDSNFMPLEQPGWASLAATLIIIGCGIVFSSLFISSMSMKKLEVYEQ